MPYDNPLEPLISLAIFLPFFIHVLWVTREHFLYTLPIGALIAYSWDNGIAWAVVLGIVYHCCCYNDCIKSQEAAERRKYLEN